MALAEILQVVCWPVVALIVALFAILIFKKPLTDLLSRLKRLGIAGVTLDTDTALAAVSNQSESKPVEPGLTVKASPDAPSESRLRQLKSIDVSPIVQEQQRLIRADVQKLGVPQQEQVELLIKSLAVTQLSLRAESIYRTIFGSQIALLKSLNISPSGATRAQLSEYYKNAQARFPQVYANYSFEQYLQYLLTQRLVTTNDNQHYFITVAGQEFLKWMPAA